MTTDATRRALAAEARAGFPANRGGSRRIAARAALGRALYSTAGARRVPGGAELDRALTALHADDLAWFCEFSPLGPLYLLPTTSFVTALAKQLRALGARRVLEVAAGDGALSRALAKTAPELEVIATDSGAWTAPEARMTAKEQRAHRGERVPGLLLGADVQRLEARRAVRKFAPDVVLASWLPPGHALLDALIRSQVAYVLEIGAGNGVTASAYCWRFAHEFLEGPLERAARCRLDLRPREALHSRITLYYGAAHPEHHREVVRKGDWLYQFRP